MATARRFPVPEHVMWTNCLENLPRISNDTVADLINQAPTSSKQQTKSYAFAVEAYTLPSSVVTNACDTSLGIVYARATCYRSQKKSGRPYKVSLALKSDSGAVADSTCECPAGAGGACSHILAALRLLVLLKQKGFKEAPPELSCTELPQQWRRPRRQGIRPMAVQNMDWRSPREGGMGMPMPVRLFDARAEEQKEQQHLEAIHSLGEDLQSLGTFDFAAILLAAGGPSVDTKLGPAPAGSALSYQQAKHPAGFTTWMSPSISQGAATVTPVPAFTLFSDGASQPPLPGRFTAEEWRVLTEIQLSQEEARDLELNSRQQRLSERWRQARANRLTASTFGRVVRRQAWTEKGLRNLIEPKDLTHIRTVQYGIRNENMAKDRYIAVMNSYGHNVSVQHCGLVVDPVCPWLGATPDGLVYDPEELAYGVLEVKCPHSLKDSEPEEAKKRKFSLVFGENGEPQLDRDHEYYAKVLGQMALTGCLWGDFVVCSEKWIGIERIWFDRNEWEEMRKKLDAFFFEHMLPHLARR
ncbi:uncharacterized protein LOC119395886 [Rhipicephalus sanguineus]|uniref:uncharacterized protein LOC119395886 n=1 Tax=Rhipicephalus sanguineus TaxID=34632 RepID=UPI001896044F|nr:uncharacterized protein LOC119395886 [Rhipicephalus sanguineus]